MISLLKHFPGRVTDDDSGRWGCVAQYHIADDYHVVILSDLIVKFDNAGNMLAAAMVRSLTIGAWFDGHMPGTYCIGF